MTPATRMGEVKMMRTFLAFVVYHLAIGIVVTSVLQTEHHLSPIERAGWIAGWPLVVGANIYMQDKWITLIDEIQVTLDEPNSGRWERKAHGDPPPDAAR